MQIEKIEFDEIRYNPERGAFETLVQVHDGGKSYSYPAHVRAPLTAEFPAIAHGLADAARRAHLARTPGLRALTRDDAETADVPPPVPSLLDRFLGKVAA